MKSFTVKFYLAGGEKWETDLLSYDEMKSIVRQVKAKNETKKPEDREVYSIFEWSSLGTGEDVSYEYKNI